MNPVWSVVLVLVAFLIVLRLKNRKKLPKQKKPVYARRVEGFQVNAYLNPEIGSGCLFDNGLQYGDGFRRKEGPDLPHDPHCRCITTPFTFTSTEVFNGELRKISKVRSAIPNLTHDDAFKMIESLKRINGSELPEKQTDYTASIKTENFPSGIQPGIEEFLAARYLFLKENLIENNSSKADNKIPEEVEGATEQK